jgi:hydrogenase maturation factor
MATAQPFAAFPSAQASVQVQVVSNPRPDMVSGGDALVQVDVPAGASAHDVRVTLNNADVTSGFRADAAGRMLTSQGLATAAIDLSDGLSGDLAHLCEQSGVGAEIQATALPLSHACRAYAAACGTDPIRLALTGGEDYELLFTVSPRNRVRLERLGLRLDCRLSCIGIVRPKASGLRLRDENGTLRRLAVTSYQHFQNKLPL